MFVVLLFFKIFKFKLATSIHPVHRTYIYIYISVIILCLYVSLYSPHMLSAMANLLKTASYEYRYIKPRNKVFLLCESPGMHWSQWPVLTCNTRLANDRPTLVAFQCPKMAASVVQPVLPVSPESSTQTKSAQIIEVDHEMAEFMSQRMNLPLLVYMSAKSDIVTKETRVQCAVRMNKPFRRSRM